MIQTRGTHFTKTLCDRCGKTALSTKEAYKYRLSRNGKEYDLCPKCYAAMCYFLRDKREHNRWEATCKS